MAENWAQYVRRATQGTTQVQLALVTGVAQTAIGRWLRGETAAPRAESVVAFARAIGKPPVEALVAAGYLTSQEAAQRIEVTRAINDYSTDDLLEELRRRTINGG
ncbi:MAG TPA: helix-turn-helix transcriptional regulator [Mycobacterium sp.]|nr:helix-turn-helix transcriptional regulator [Mycobacterium sp.]